GYGYPNKQEKRKLTKKQRYEITSKPIGVLHAIHIPVMNPNEKQADMVCRKHYQIYRSMETFCVGPDQSSSSLALYDGDRGSPLICPSLDGNYRVLGLMTYQLPMNEQDHLFP
ncbi:hypothetical protein BLA29_014133, partial [Euroglyphus maynei]